MRCRLDPFIIPKRIADALLHELGLAHGEDRKPQRLLVFMTQGSRKESRPTLSAGRRPAHVLCKQTYHSIRTLYIQRPTYIQAREKLCIILKWKRAFD